MSMVRLSVNELHARAVKGDKDAENLLFTTLIDRFRFFVQLREGNVSEVEDIVQNAIIVIYEKYRDIEITTSFTSWAYKVLRLTLLGGHKKNQRRIQLDKYYQDSITVKASFQDIIFKDLKNKLIICFRQLHQVKPQYARVLNLIHLGYKTSEICEKLEMTASNLYTVLSRARSLLFKCLEKGKLK